MDVPLNDHGRRQAATLAFSLKVENLQAILSSDLSRARETAEILSQGLGGVPIHIDERLREAHMGDAQGKTAKEIEAHFGSDLANKWKNAHPTDADLHYPGGETNAQITLRSMQAIEEFLMSKQLDTIGVSTHGGVIRRVMQVILGPNEPIVPIPNCVLYELHYDPLTNKWSKV